MDIVAHMLWAGAGGVLVARRRPVAHRTLVALVGLAAAPDLPQFAPVLGWVLFGTGSWAELLAHAVASPGQEPPLPTLVALVSHHLHCMAHSAVVAAAVTAVAWALRGAVWLPLWGWWSHIVIDAFSHSRRFYPAPILYPLSDASIDGAAWNEPLFVALNYAALAAVWAWLLHDRAVGTIARPTGSEP